MAARSIEAGGPSGGAWDAAGPARICATALGLPPGEALWVFGYGSLMWNPGFAFLDRRSALLRGYHRTFCVYSHRYRGTPERPGLVLGLDRGGSCRGIAFQVAPADAAAVLEYLAERELITGVYRPRMVRVETGADTVRACTFVAERAHGQYCGNLGVERTAEFIRQGCGERGPNVEYLVNTVMHLRELGIHDAPLERLMAEVLACRAAAAPRIQGGPTPALPGTTP